MVRIWSGHMTPKGKTNTDKTIVSKVKGPKNITIIHTNKERKNKLILNYTGEKK
jgi:hypothetical protein